MAKVNDIKISCEGDGFRYEYFEEGSQKLISKCFGPLIHNLKIKITSGGKDNEFSIKDISCYETYDKIISPEFEEYLEKNDMFEMPTTLYQFRQNGVYFFDALILDDDEKFDINRLGGELIIPLGDLFKQPGLKHFIYEKNNGKKVKIKFKNGQYNENNWDPVESNYDLEIEHYTEKLTQNQYWHSKIFFNEDPKDFLKDYDDIGHIKSIGDLVKDQRFKSSFLEDILEVGFNTWAKKEILDEVLKSFEQNSNCKDELIKQFKERMKLAVVQNEDEDKEQQNANEKPIHLYVHQSIHDVLEKETDNDDEFLYWKLKGSSEPFSGVVQFYDKDNNELSKVEFRNGKMYNGDWFMFHPNGHPKTVMKFERGKWKAFNFKSPE